MGIRTSKWGREKEREIRKTRPRVVALNLKEENFETW